MKKTKRVEVHGVQFANGQVHACWPTRKGAAVAASGYNGRAMLVTVHSFVELRPGEVVVTREEVKVLRLARKVARCSTALSRGDLLLACSALRATKARKR